ncbi:MAG: hypothetical protein EP319_02790 [Deltaproteobacteria bacterium]|nr:MAG: hypothetical protein EP319_02790 [Deltaproteobacteria bacterium]
MKKRTLKAFGIISFALLLGTVSVLVFNTEVVADNDTSNHVDEDSIQEVVDVLINKETSDTCLIITKPDGKPFEISAELRLTKRYEVKKCYEIETHRYRDEYRFAQVGEPVVECFEDLTDPNDVPEVIQELLDTYPETGDATAGESYRLPKFVEELSSKKEFKEGFFRTRMDLNLSDVRWEVSQNKLIIYAIDLNMGDEEVLYYNFEHLLAFSLFDKNKNTLAITKACGAPL